MTNGTSEVLKSSRQSETRERKHFAVKQLNVGLNLRPQTELCVLLCSGFS